MNEASVPFNGSFIFVGGEAGLEASKSIYAYEPESEGWTKLPGELGVPKKDAVAMFVRRESFPGCTQ